MFVTTIIVGTETAIVLSSYLPRKVQMTNAKGFARTGQIVPVPDVSPDGSGVSDRRLRPDVDR